MKWSELRRASDIILAVWPHCRLLHERWFMQELVDKGALRMRVHFATPSRILRLSRMVSML